MTGIDPQVIQVIVQDLEDAATHIEAVGWIQEATYDTRQRKAGTPPDRCRVCAYGALAVVISGHPEHGWSKPAAERMSYAVHAFYRHFRVDLVKYNDAPGRTAEQVTAALRATAARLRTGDLELVA